MKKGMFVLLGCVLALILVAGACAQTSPSTAQPPAPAPAPAPAAAPAAPAKPVELTYSYQFPADYGQSLNIIEWGKTIESLSQGRVKITMYPANTLTPAAQAYDGAVNGVSDLAAAFGSYTPGRFPIMGMLDLPAGHIMNAAANSLMGMDLYNKFKPKELADTHFLYVSVFMPGAIITANKPVRTMEDLKGMRIRATGIANACVTALGASPVSMTADAVYDALWKNTVDGTVGTPNMLEGWKYGEVSKYTTLAGQAGYCGAYLVVMNNAKWNSLPADIQNIFTTVSNLWAEKSGETWNQMEWHGYNWAKAKGHQFITLDPQEEARWVSAITPVVNDYAKGVDDKGLPGTDALNYVKQRADQYSQTYPAVIFK